MNDKNLRQMSDFIADAVLTIDPDFIQVDDHVDEVKILSDYFFLHPSEMKEAIEDHRIDVTEI